MSAKTDFMAALNDLPDGLGDLVSTPIPTAPTISTPGTVDAAIIANGVLCKYLLDFFAAFEGFTPLEALMRIGQKNIVTQGMLLAGLEYIGARGEIALIAPVNGGIYYGYFSRWKAELIRGGVDVVVGNIGGDEFDLEEVEEKLFSVDWPVPIGRHTASVYGSYGGEIVTAVEEVAFEVKSWADVPTIPATGDALTGPLEEIQFLTGTQTDDIEEDMAVSVDGDAPVSMIKMSLLGFSATVTITPDSELHTLTFYMGGNETKNVVFSFSAT